MKPYINYIIETAISLGVFTLVYLLFLRRETRFNANRFYLMGAILFSTLLPFLSIKTNFNSITGIFEKSSGETFYGNNLLETVTVYASGIPARVSNIILSFDFSILIYFLGATAALFMIITGIIQLIKIVTANRKFTLKGAKLVISKRETAPYSFFNFIFIGRDLIAQENWKSIVQHEVEHMKQGHSFDILFIDFMMVFQWFNPFYWLIRRMVRENHEYIADNGVINKGLITPANYMSLLLTQAIGGRPVVTSNFFNVKTIKKRFKMIRNNKKGKYSILKYCTVILISVATTFVFACEQKPKAVNNDSSIENIKSENTDKVYETAEIMPEYPGGQQALIQYISGVVKYPENAVREGIQGKVYVKFVVSEKGKIEKAEIARGVCTELDTEALRVVNSMPDWKPGVNGGKAVKVSYTIPINFQLK